MDSIDTRPAGTENPTHKVRVVSIGSVADVLPGHCVAVDLGGGLELALYNIDGEFHATSNFCLHQGAPLAEGKLCGHIVECGWHGWQFDVRTGECLTAGQNVETYRVIVEDGIVRVEV